MRYKFLVFMVIAIIVVGCKKRLPPNQYVNWFKTSEDNLNKSNTDNFEFEARYTSPKATALIEFEGNKDSLNKHLFEFEKFANFNLKVFAKEKSKDVLKYNIAKESDYYERLQYFISYFNYDVVAIDKKKDTLPCVFHHYERTYNITPFANLSISFESEIKNIDRLLVKLPFDNKIAEIKINKITYPELKL